MPVNIALKLFREMKGWTQQQAVEKIFNKTKVNISRRYLSLLETGERTPSIKVAWAIAETYGTSIDRLFYKMEENKNAK